jgi:hypothetical protein
MKRCASLLSAVTMTGLAAVAILTVAPASGAATPKALPTITVALTGKSVAVGGTPVSGAVNITSTTTGVADAEPTLLRLNPGATFAQAFGAAAAHHGDPNYLDPYGSIVFDADAPKGTSTEQTVLTPGTYVALDTSGNNPAKWPQTQFTVTDAGSPAQLPAAQATVKSIEFGFTGPSSFHSGEVVRFENAGFLVHMADAFGVKNTRDAKKVIALLKAGKDRQAQKLATQNFFAFAGPVSSGAVQQGVVHAKPGAYILACFMNTQDGREHTQLGMERMIRVTK